MADSCQNSRLAREFFSRDVLEVAPELLGKKLIRIWPDGSRSTYTITETEAYRGEEDLACHASKGKTSRTRVMYGPGGHLYIYLIYGIHWMLNVVTAEAGNPQAVLFRGLLESSGPGRLTRLMGVDRGFYGEDLVQSERIWIEKGMESPDYRTAPRVGIDFAGEPWKKKPWRFLLNL